MKRKPKDNYDPNVDEDGDDDAVLDFSDLEPDEELDFNDDNQATDYDGYEDRTE